MIILGLLMVDLQTFLERTDRYLVHGTERSDDIPAMLSDGEFVVNAKAVRGIGSLMGMENQRARQNNEEKELEPCMRFKVQAKKLPVLERLNKWQTTKKLNKKVEPFIGPEATQTFVDPALELRQGNHLVKLLWWT